MSSNARHIKRVTLTSKKNWWMVELDEEERHAAQNEHAPPAYSAPFADEVPEPKESHPPTPYRSHAYTPRVHHETTMSRTTPTPSGSIFIPPNNPLSIFSFPTPTTYSAPPNPTQNLAPCAAGSASELFKCIVKKPNVVQLEINGEMQSNASDVMTQFLAELRVYTTVSCHRNIATFLGCLENVGMVLEYIEGRSLWDVVRERPEISRSKKIDYHNQLLDGLTHLHAFGLNHGDLSLLNVQVTLSSDTIKLLDFGRSVAADSIYASPFEDLNEPPAPPVPMRPFPNSRFVPQTPQSAFPPPPQPMTSRKVEQIHPGTRPFSAPEILRGECQDACLADAYSFGMILVCLDRCDLVDVKPWVQRKDGLPNGFLDNLVVFQDRCEQYLRRWDQGRRRLVKEDMMVSDEPMEL